MSATYEVINPANEQSVKSVDLADLAATDKLIEMAHKAFTSWKKIAPGDRAKLLRSFAQVVSDHREELAALEVTNAGHTIGNALWEADNVANVLNYYSASPERLFGKQIPVANGVDITFKEPLGVVGVIVPWNFQMPIAGWGFAPALAAGHTLVLKPAEYTPMTAMRLGELALKAGIPEGVFNVVHGDKVSVDSLLTHPGIKSVSFVGSTPIAKYVYETGTKAGKRVQALGGAKNHMIVLPDADLDLAADAAINAGFGSAGERCMAISAIVAVEPIADKLIEKITERATKIKTGDGTKGADMGPLVTKVHRDKVAAYIEAGEKEGAKIVFDGRKVVVDGDGFWLGPTLFDQVKPSMSIYQEEIFGPVLSVIRVKSYDEALKLVNDHQYGNGTAIFTNDGGAARRFQNEVEVGMVGINVPIPVPMAYFSFGGWKNSLFGDSHAHGTEGVHFFTRGKVVTSRWLDPSHGGINLGFPQNT